MDQKDLFAAMPKMNTNDNSHNEPEHGQPLPEIPPTIGPERPPQRNDANATCHCGTCACPCAQPPGGRGIGFGFAERVTTEAGRDGLGSKASSEAGDPINDGDEGAEDHLIEVGDFGYIPISLIRRTLAKHAPGRCNCYGIIASPDDYPFPSNYSAPVISGMVSPGDSMVVHVGSGEASMASSGIFGLHSNGSSVSDYIHGGFDPNALNEAFPVLYCPLQLTADVPYPMELSFSSASERDYSVSADDFRVHDMW